MGLDALTQPQAIILAGFLGALTAILANVVTYLLTVRGQDKRRWDQRRMEAYAGYARTVKKITFLAVSVAAARGLPYFIAPLDPDEGVPALASAEEQRADLWEEVLLLGSPDVVKVAREWHQRAWHLAEFARGHHIDPNAWTTAVDANDQARSSFYRHARNDLAVARGELPPTMWPPAWLEKSPEMKPES